MQDTDECCPLIWAENLAEALSGLGPVTGGRYRRIVQWCLDADANEIVGERAFVENILDPLDDLVQVLS